MFTLFGSNFSCDTWSGYLLLQSRVVTYRYIETKTECKRVDLAFVVGSWVMTGLRELFFALKVSIAGR